MPKIVTYIFICTLFFHCTQKNTEKHLSEKKIKILTSIPPQRFFIKKIGQKLVDVEVLAKTLTNHEQNISINTLSKFTHSKLYIHIGIKGFLFEKNAKKQLKILSQNTMHILPLFKNDKKTYSDPHLWLSPKKVLKATTNIYKALVHIDPKNKHTYTTHYKAFKNEIISLDKTLHQTLKNLHKKVFLSYHPAWNYFAKDYGLKEIPIQQEHKKTSLKKLHTLIQYAHKNNIKTIAIPHKLYEKKVHSLVKSLNATLIILDPLAENWDTNLIKVSKTLHKALSKT